MAKVMSRTKKLMHDSAPSKREDMSLHFAETFFGLLLHPSDEVVAAKHKKIINMENDDANQFPCGKAVGEQKIHHVVKI